MILIKNGKVIKKVNLTTSSENYGHAAGRVSIVQYIYSQAHTAAELMQEAKWQANLEVLHSV